MACINFGFLSEIFPLSPEKSLFTWAATSMPHPSFLICLPGTVLTRSSSKHFRRVTHCRDFIDDVQPVLPPTLPANLFETILLRNARRAVTSSIVDTRRCKFRQSADTPPGAAICQLGQLDAIDPARMVGGLDVDEQPGAHLHHPRSGSALAPNGSGTIGWQQPRATGRLSHGRTHLINAEGARTSVRRGVVQRRRLGYFPTRLRTVQVPAG